MWNVGSSDQSICKHQVGESQQFSFFFDSLKSLPRILKRNLEALDSTIGTEQCFSTFATLTCVDFNSTVFTGTDLFLISYSMLQHVSLTVHHSNLFTAHLEFLLGHCVPLQRHISCCYWLTARRSCFDMEYDHWKIFILIKIFFTP